MKISIIGGGNIGTLLAADCSKKGHEVTVYTTKSYKWSTNILVYKANDELEFKSKIIKATDNLPSAIKDANIIFVTYPLHVLKQMATKMLKFITKGQIIGVIPGGCAEFFFTDHIKKGAVLFGLQDVPSVTRVKETGHSSYRLDRKEQLVLSSFPSCKADELSSFISQLLDTKTIVAPSYLNQTFIPLNSILHTCRIRTLFASWKTGVTYNRNFEFYTEWTTEAAQKMIDCAKEYKEICLELSNYDLSVVIKQLEVFETLTAKELAHNISTTEAYQNISSPMIEVSNGCWIPDLTNRYFTSDFAFGLRAIQQIARAIDFDTPTIDDIITWYEEVATNIKWIEDVPKTKENLISLYALQGL